MMSEYRFDENFDLFLSEFGEPAQQVQIPETVIQHYATKLPAQLLTYWRGVGACSFHDGLLWMVNPEDYKVTLEEWLEGTPFEKRKDLAVFARTAFGELKVWAKGRGNIMNIDPHHSIIFHFAGADKGSWNEQEEDFDMRVWWGASSPENFDYEDASEKHLFKRALKKLSFLTDEDMYGFSHSLALGGKETLDNLDVVKLEVYHDLARQMKEPEIVELDV
jgi:hypothetical protein